eukprot:GHVP01012781.1.p1 GENE.GHVP01012781.1~~GHVP01012781.1.p1  ORF type:complete len:226 (+),score=34.71 GHVP01012781.1:33-680(+)
MEIKLLSDQLNSALEHVTSPQGVGTLPDELIPEPAFELIQRLEINKYSGVYGFIKIGDEKPHSIFFNEKRIVRILKGADDSYSVKTLLRDDCLGSCFEQYHSKSLKCDERRKVTFIGFRDPENFDRSKTKPEDLKPGVWQIKVCHCGKTKRLTKCYQNMLKDSCPCGTFEVTDKEHKEYFGIDEGLASYFYDKYNENPDFKKVHFDSISDGSSLE